MSRWSEGRKEGVGIVRVKGQEGGEFGLRDEGGGRGTRADGRLWGEMRWVCELLEGHGGLEGVLWRRHGVICGKTDTPNAFFTEITKISR